MTTTDVPGQQADADRPPIPTPLDVARQRDSRSTSAGQHDEPMFTPEQQAEVNRIVQERVQRVEAKYAAVDVEEAQRRLSELDEQIRNGDNIVLRNSIAARIGLSPEDRDLLLTGKDEATLELQAKLLIERWGLGKAQGNVAPREGQTVSPSTAQGDEMRQFVDHLFGSEDIW